MVATFNFGGGHGFGIRNGFFETFVRFVQSRIADGSVVSSSIQKKFGTDYIKNLAVFEIGHLDLDNFQTHDFVELLALARAMKETFPASAPMWNLEYVDVFHKFTELLILAIEAKLSSQQKSDGP